MQIESRAAWTRRFGLIAGGGTGLLVAFALAFTVLPNRPALLRVLAAAGFIGGALLGERLAVRAGSAAYRWFGLLAGLALALVLGLAYLALVGGLRRS